jgi:hypothetical protein
VKRIITDTGEPYDKGTTILGRDGKLRGRATGGTRPCIDGCPGVKFAVRWQDGKLTWVCTTDVVPRREDYQLRPRSQP